MDKSSLLDGRTNPIAHADPPQRDLSTAKPSAHGRNKGTSLLAVAASLLLLLAAAQGYVSFRAQYTFVDHAKHAHVPSLLEALGLDTGAVIFALLALALACRGGRAAVERILNVACALGSLTMNLLAANLTSPRSITVWVLPSALYALTSDRLIAVMRRWAQTTHPDARLADDGSAWQVLADLALWSLRLIFDTPGTVRGFRRWVLAVAPVAPGVRSSAPSSAGAHIAALHRANPRTDSRTDHRTEQKLPRSQANREPRRTIAPRAPDALSGDALAPGETKREALIRLYERRGQNGDPRYGDRTKAAALAGEIAGRIGYHPGTARRELTRYLAAQSEVSITLQPEATPDTAETATPTTAHQELDRYPADHSKASSTTQPNAAPDAEEVAS